MQLLEVQESNREQWDRFVGRVSADGGFLQSWRWGEFQKSLGRHVLRLAAVGEDGELVAAAQLLQHELPLDHKYYYVPRGPVIDFERCSDVPGFFDAIAAYAGEHKGFMVRIDPAWTNGAVEMLETYRFRKADQEIQPRCNFIIDISRTDEELLADMKQKTRYNVRLAKKKGVTVRWSTEPSDVELFWQLMKQTSERGNFTSHPKEYYKKMFELFSQDGTMQLALAESEGQLLAAHFVVFFNRVATYLHGASADAYRGLMAPYLAQYRSIQQAKERGCLFFDFGGVNGKSYQNEKWNGITQFKTGFSTTTEPTEFIGNYELVLNPVIYAGYKFVRQVRGQ